MSATTVPVPFVNSVCHMKNLMYLLHQNISCEDSMLMKKVNEYVKDELLDQLNADYYVDIFENMDRKVSFFLITTST